MNHPIVCIAGLALLATTGCAARVTCNSPPPAPAPAAAPIPPPLPYLPGFWIGTHPHWTSGILFGADQRFRRDGSEDGGTWSFDLDTRTLTLAWDGWAADRLTWDGTAFVSPAFRIDRPAGAATPR